MPTNARVPSVRWLGALLVLLVGPGAVAAADLGTSSDSGIADRISALTVFGKGTPPLRVPHYRTSGAYP
jgi:hypothetical protein